MGFFNFKTKTSEEELEKSGHAKDAEFKNASSESYAKTQTSSADVTQHSVQFVNISRDELDKRLCNLEMRALDIQKIIDEQKALLADVFNDITAIKMSISQCIKDYKDDGNREFTKEKAEEYNPTNEENIVPIEAKIPKKLDISGYRTVYDNVEKNLYELIGYSDLLYNNCKISCTTKIEIPELAWLLSDCKKEVILIKTKYKFSDEELEELGTIIRTCEKIAELKKKGDKLGYEKYLSFFSEKYPIPADPFTEEAPTDYFSGIDSHPYVTTFHVRYLLKRLYPNICKKRDRLMNCSHDYYRDVVIDVEFVSMLKTIADLLLRGYTIGIIPILDENILYRPQSAAQDENCLSLLYYENYVETPTFITAEKQEATPITSFSYSGSCYVSGHYRQGHWRNGHWVSGGYVRGHFRS